jgi:hypothetical protein
MASYNFKLQIMSDGTRRLESEILESWTGMPHAAYQSFILLDYRFGRKKSSQHKCSGLNSGLDNITRVRGHQNGHGGQICNSCKMREDLTTLGLNYSFHNNDRLSFLSKRASSLLHSPRTMSRLTCTRNTLKPLDQPIHAAKRIIHYSSVNFSDK